jgi:hypothetical protein
VKTDAGGCPAATHFGCFSKAHRARLRGVFEYDRAIALKEDASSAYEAMTKVWSPRGAWKPFIQQALRKHGISFEPY